MNPVERYEKYKDDFFDTIILRIRNGDIKCGRYSNRIKLDKNLKTPKGELFAEKEDKSDGSKILGRE